MRVRIIVAIRLFSFYLKKHLASYLIRTEEDIEKGKIMLKCRPKPLITDLDDFNNKKKNNVNRNLSVDLKNRF